MKSNRIKINIESQPDIKLRVDPEEVEKVGQMIAVGENIYEDLTATLILVDDEKIRALNRKYRHRDKVTDVLSFESDESDYLGEVVICYPEVIRRGKESDVRVEWMRLLIHGLLHLLGYDHVEADEIEMEKKEKMYLAKVRNKDEVY